MPTFNEGAYGAGEYPKESWSLEPHREKNVELILATMKNCFEMKQWRALMEDADTLAEYLKILLKYNDTQED